MLSRIRLSALVVVVVVVGEETHYCTEPGGQVLAAAPRDDEDSVARVRRQRLQECQHLWARPRVDARLRQQCAVVVQQEQPLARSARLRCDQVSSLPRAV